MPTLKLQFKIVWRRFHWQRIGRFWLYYFDPIRGEWAHGKLSETYKLLKYQVYGYGRNDGFISGRKGA